MRVTAALTDLAVTSVQTALRFLLRQEVARVVVGQTAVVDRLVIALLILFAA